MELDFTDPVKLKRLPQPTGCKLLVAITKTPEKVGSVFLPENIRQREETANITALVLLQGPDAYKDTEMFPSGPYCQPGEVIIMRAYSGTRIKFDDENVELRLIDDRTVEAVVSDPSLIRRA